MQYPKPPAPWRQLCALPALSRRIYPDAEDVPARWWLVGQVLRHLGEHLHLVNSLHHHRWAALLRHQPQVLRKAHQQYPFHGLDRRGRIDWLLGHWQACERQLGRGPSRALQRGREFTVCELDLPDGQGRLPVRLGPARQNHLREGDLTLTLFDPFGTRLYAMTFSLQPLADGGCEMLVGALQSRMPLELTRHLTRLSHGLRPANLMVELLQGLAGAMGVQRLRACGRQRHIHHGSEKADQVQFDYDGFWESCGGEPDGEGFFLLPAAPARRRHEDMPSHKRSQYRRRYAWLDEQQATLRRLTGAIGIRGRA